LRGDVEITNGVRVNEIFDAKDTPSKERRKQKQTRSLCLALVLSKKTNPFIWSEDDKRVVLFGLKNYTYIGPVRSPIRIKGPTNKDFAYS